MSESASTLRRSSRHRRTATEEAASGNGNQTAAWRPPQRRVALAADFRQPWSTHYNDILAGRIQKCTKRIQNASNNDIANLPISFLAMATEMSSTKHPKQKQEQYLVEYAQAVMERGIQPNDDIGSKRNQSALAWAAYYGHLRLVKLLLDAGSPVGIGDPVVLWSAVEGRKHACIGLLFRERHSEICAQLQKESLTTWPRRHKPTALLLASSRKDVETVRILRDQGRAVLCAVTSPSWKYILKKLYVGGENYSCWSPKLHWSFPGNDRQVLNWLWYALERQRQIEGDKNTNGGTTIPLLPPEMWLRVFGFVGRWWWGWQAS